MNMVPSLSDPSRSRGRRFVPGFALAVALIALAGGCGYTIRAPYDTNIKTVFVPIAISNTFHRDLNFQLTKLVQDEIRNRTCRSAVPRPRRP